MDARPERCRLPFAAPRRCFTPAAMQASYDLAPLYAANDEGQGVTIAIIDSFGNPNMASDLANFDTQMSLPHMCREPGQACGTGTPTFQHLYWNGKTEVKSPPPNSHNPGLQDRNLDAGDQPRCRVGPRHRPDGEHHRRDH